MSRRLGVAPKATPRLVRSTARRVSPETWSTSGRITSGQQGSPSQPVPADAWHPPTPGCLARRTSQQWDRSPGGTAESSADDRLGVVGVTLQRGPGKQPAHQLTALDLEAQRHIRGHSQFPGDQVGRTCLPHVAGDAVQGIYPPPRQQGPAAPCPARSRRAPTRRGPDIAGRLETGRATAVQPGGRSTANWSVISRRWLWNRNSAAGRPPACPGGRDWPVGSSTPRRSNTRCRLVADTSCPSAARYTVRSSEIVKRGGASAKPTLV